MISGIVRFNDTEHKCIILQSDKEKRRGLMLVKPPAPIVVFFFYPNVNRFWMKDTIAPLDIVFLLHSKVVEICDGIPESEELVGSKLSDTVIEFNKGFCEKHNIVVGSEISVM